MALRFDTLASCLAPRVDTLHFSPTCAGLIIEEATVLSASGFTLMHGRRPATALSLVAVEADPLDAQHKDGRVAVAARLAARLLDAVEKRATASPSFSDGHRVQVLIDAARRSHAQGRLVDIPGVTP